MKRNADILSTDSSRRQALCRAFDILDCSSSQGCGKSFGRGKGGFFGLLFSGTPGTRTLIFGLCRVDKYSDRFDFHPPSEGLLNLLSLTRD